MSWFIRNIRDVQWYDAGRFGVYGDFEQGERFPDLGFNFGVVWPGQPVALYHREDHQEGFLVLSGECRLIVEGEERALKQWGYPVDAVAFEAPGRGGAGDDGSGRGLRAVPEARADPVPRGVPAGPA